MTPPAIVAFFIVGSPAKGPGQAATKTARNARARERLRQPEDRIHTDRDHSERRASTGFRRAAREAGTMEATRATMPKARPARAMKRGSVAETP